MPTSATFAGLLDVSLSAQTAQQILSATARAADQFGQPGIGTARESEDVRQHDLFADGKGQGGDGCRDIDFKIFRVHSVYVEPNCRADIGENLFGADHSPQP